MTQQTSASPQGPPAQQGQGTGQAAREGAAEVGRTTADAGRQVASTAAEQAGQVARETRRQARDLVGEARGQATEQARAGQQKAAEGLRSLSRELHGMSDGGDGGPAADLAAQAAGRIDDIAGWLDRHEPGDVLEEVRSFARRRPGAFLLGAALAGVVAGRLTRGAVDAQRDDGPSRPGAAYGAPGDGYGTTGHLPPGPAAPVHPVPGPAGPGYPGAGPAGPGPVGPGPGPVGPGTAGPGRVPPVEPGTPPGAVPPGAVPPGAVPPGAGPGSPPPPYTGPGDGPVVPPPPPAPGPTHAPRPGATTVGEYVEELGADRPQRRDPR